jgi:hypothetical protein
MSPMNFLNPAAERFSESRAGTVCMVPARFLCLQLLQGR